MLTLPRHFLAPNRHTNHGVYVTFSKFHAQKAVRTFLCHILNALFTFNQYYDILHTLPAHLHNTFCIPFHPQRGATLAAPPASTYACVHVLSLARNGGMPGSIGCAALCKCEKLHIALHCAIYWYLHLHIIVCLAQTAHAVKRVKRVRNGNNNAQPQIKNA